MSGLEALPSWKYADVRLTALRASRAKRPASMAGVCTVAILLLAVPLFTLEADARGGFGGHGGGFGGHGGFAGRGGGFGGARSFGVARFGGAGVGARSFGVARFGGAGARARSFSVARF